MEERIYMATIQHGYGDRLKEWETHIKETKMEERIYMATIQHGYGDRLEEWETHIRAPDIFRAAEILKTDCEQRDWHVIAIEEVDYE